MHLHLTLARLGRAGALVLALGLVGGISHLAAAPPPPNDNCAGALVVPAAGPFPYLTPVVEISFATTNGDPVLPALCGDSNVNRSVWFKFTPAVSALYTLSVGPDTATDFGGPENTDTMMGVYTAPGCGGPFAYFDCNDDSLSLRSALTANLTAGTSYYVVIWAASFTAVTGQPLAVQLRVTKPTVPASDTCAGAEVIPGSGPFPYLSSVHDNTLATEIGDPNVACAGFRSVWFRFTPTVAGTYTFSTDSDTATTTFDINMALFTSAGGCSGPFTLVTCGVLTKSFSRALTANVPVYVVVWDFEAEHVPSETSVQLRVGLAGPPTVTTLPASSLTTTGVVLNLSINANTFASRWFFEWGQTTNYGNMTTSRLLPAPLALTQLRSEPISGFTPGLTYHYRAVGTNAQGKVFGLDRTFFISTNRPVITAESVQVGGDFLIQFTATAGQIYLVLGSANLMNWQDLDNARDLGGGAFEFIHSPGALPPYRYYKVRAR